jgi:hypothetical protein
MALIAQPLLDYRTCAYIECWITTKTRLLKIYGFKDTLLVLLSANKKPQAIKPIIILESREIYSPSDKSCEYIVYSGFILPLLQVHLEQIGLVWRILLVSTYGFSFRSARCLFYFCCSIYRTLNPDIIINAF